MTDVNVERLHEKLFRRPKTGEPQVRTSVFAILDGARDRRISRALSDTVLPFRCLFTGKLDPALAAVAPHLVEFKGGFDLHQLLLDKGWGNAWGIFAVSSAPLEELRRHFRRFLRVEDERGKRLFFRFYDPRVFRLYLPTCTSDELAKVFGPVTRYVMEGADPEQMLEFSVQRGALVTRIIDLRDQRVVTEP